MRSFAVASDRNSAAHSASREARGLDESMHLRDAEIAPSAELGNSWVALPKHAQFLRQVANVCASIEGAFALLLSTLGVMGVRCLEGWSCCRWSFSAHLGSRVGFA